MAWSTPPTFTSGNVLTAAQKNIERDNFNETAPAKATGGSGIIVTTGLNGVTQRTPNFGEALAANSTTNTNYSFFTSGPSVFIGSTGSVAWVFITAMMSNNTADQGARMSIDSIGSHAPGDATALAITSGTANAANRGTCLLRVSGLTPGNNTFTAVYRAAATGTASFLQRRMDVLPL